MKKLRAWVTPITIGSFLLIGVTGVLMFFKVAGSLVIVAHEWLSPVFVVGSCLHVWLNWGAVRANLTRARGIAIVGVFAALLGVSVAPFEAVEEIARQHGHGEQAMGRQAAELMLQARISTVAELTGRTPQQLRERLGRHGIRVATDKVTLGEAARQCDVEPGRALDAVLREE
jgi:hypothetical protein